MKDMVANAVNMSHKPKNASQISINPDKIAKQKRKEVEELLEMERRRMGWFEFLCVNSNLPSNMR